MGDITTLARVKEYAAISDSSSDTVLTNLIAAVEERIKTYLRRATLIPTFTVGEIHDHSGKSDRLQLRQWPIATVSEVRIDGTALDAADFAIEDLAAGWLVYQPGGTPGEWPSGRRHIAVDYTHGYSQMPADLIEAATTQVVWQFKRTGHQGGRLGSRTTEQGEGATATWMVDAWAPEVLSQLAPYRRVELV